MENVHEAAILTWSLYVSKLPLHIDVSSETVEGMDTFCCVGTPSSRPHSCLSAPFPLQGEGWGEGILFSPPLAGEVGGGSFPFVLSSPKGVSKHEHSLRAGYLGTPYLFQRDIPIVVFVIEETYCLFLPQ